MEDNAVPTIPVGNQVQQPNLVQPSIQETQQQSNPPPPTENKKKISKTAVGAIAIFIVSLITFLGVIGAYFYITNNKTEKTEEISRTTEPQTATISANSSWYIEDVPLPKDKSTGVVSKNIDISGWETYTDDYFGYSISFPQEFVAGCENEAECFIVYANSSSITDIDDVLYEDSPSYVGIYDFNSEEGYSDDYDPRTDPDNIFFNNLLSSEVGETTSYVYNEEDLSATFDEEEVSYIRESDINVDGVNAKVFVSSSGGLDGSDLDKMIHVIKGEKQILIWGILYENKINEKLFDEIAATFKFLE